MDKQLLSELARFADKKSKILSEEARLWQDVSEWLARVWIPEATHVRSVELTQVQDNISAATLSAQQAAEFLGLSKQTLAKLRVYGGGPEYAKIGRRVVYRREALEAFLSDRARPHTSSYVMYAGKHRSKVR